MNESESFDRSHERAFSVALLRLNELIEAGRDEEAEGDAVRDEMDMQWYRMDDRQRERMDYLAVDLEHLAQAKGKPDYVGPIDREWAKEYQVTWDIMTEAGADRVLALLRDRRAGLPSGNHIFVQARNYERLGMPEVALSFYETAESRDKSFATMTLIFLWQQGRMDLALPRAESVLVNGSQDNLAVFFACSVLMDAIRHTDVDASRPIYERIHRHLASVAKSLEMELLKSHNVVELYLNTIMVLGICFGRLGKYDTAIKTFDHYLANNARSPVGDADIYSLRGFAKLTGNFQGALVDFRSAVGKRASSAWPYIFLVHDALNRNSLLEAMSLCNFTLDNLSEVPDIAKALLYEGRGITMARLGQPKERVLENFDRAIDLVPEEPRLHHNRATAAAGSNSDQWRKIVSERTLEISQARFAYASTQQFIDRFAKQASQSMEIAGSRSVA